MPRIGTALGLLVLVAFMAATASSPLDLAATSVASAACLPRPNAGVSATRSGTVLRVIARPGTGLIRQLRFWDTQQRPDSPSNAVIDIDNGPSNIRASYTYDLPNGQSSVSFSLRQASGAGAVQVPLVIVDDCGDWHTFVGGGDRAFLASTSTPTSMLPPTPTLTPTPTQPTQTTTTVTLNATTASPGLDTGVNAVAGQSLAITASGRAVYGYDGAGCPSGYLATDPDGTRYNGNTTCPAKYDSNAVLASAPIGALIGRIGSGAWFLVGTALSTTASSSGRLYLLYNEAYWPDNSGSYTVTIRVGAPSTPSWRILVLIFDRTDFTYVKNGVTHRVIAQMTAQEQQLAEATARDFILTDIPALNSGQMRPSVTVRAAGTITQMSTYDTGWWPAPPDVSSSLDTSFDSFIAIWDQSGIDQSTGQAANLQTSAAGLSVTYGTTIAYSAIATDYINTASRNIYKHEWGHQILGYFDAAGTAPRPTADNHGPQNYVNCQTRQPYVLQDETLANPIPNSIYNNQTGFTHDYYSGTTALPGSSTCLGITASAWASGGPASRVAQTGPRVVATDDERLRTPGHYAAR